MVCNTLAIWLALFGSMQFSGLAHSMKNGTLPCITLNESKRDLAVFSLIANDLRISTSLFMYRSGSSPSISENILLSRTFSLGLVSLIDDAEAYISTCE